MAVVQKPQKIKIITLGGAEVGKSCLIKRYCEKRFVSKYMATLGIDYGMTELIVDNKPIKVNIFDMGGQPFFYEVRNEFYKGVQGVVLVYDVTNRDSFESLEGWLCELLNHSSIHIDDMVIALCANKKDLSGHMVDDNEGQIFADSRGFLHYKTSAKTGDNVTQMFEDLVGSIVRGNGKDLVKMNYTKEQAGLVMKIKMATSNHEVLGLQQSHSSKDDVIKAFKQLAFQLHPDKNSAPGSEDAFKIICRAKDELLDNRI